MDNSGSDVSVGAVSPRSKDNADKKKKRKKKNNKNKNKENKENKEQAVVSEEKKKVFDPLADLDDTQKDLLHQFKLRLGLIKGEEDKATGDKLTKKQRRWCDDMCCLRYLRAREWDLDASELMIRNTIKWRAEYKPEAITAQEIEPEARQGKMYLHVSYDKANRPLVYMKPGMDTGTDRVLKVKYLVWILELAIANMDASQGVEKMSWIADFTGTGMRQSGVGNIALSKECLHVVCDHYPERLGKAFLINTPWVFGAFWKCISGLINAVTLEKIRVYGNDYQADINENISPENLETAYGGTSEFKYDHAKWCKQNDVIPGTDE